MTDKALISELTWRSLEMQRAAFPGMAHYLGPDEIPDLLRVSTRKDALIIHVLSLGVIADNVNAFVDFMELLPPGATVVSKEDDWMIGHKTPIRKAVILWRAARKANVQKIGGKASAKKRQDESKEACEKIKDRWPLPRKTWRTPVLLKEVGITYNTAIKYLGPRPIAQYNYQAKLKRKANKEARANA